MHKKVLLYKRRFDKKSSLWRRTARRLIRHPIMIPVVTFSVLCLITGAALLFLDQHATFKPITSYSVIVSHDGEQETVPTDEPTVGALLAKLGITLNKGDVVEPSTATQIDESNFRINVYRAVPVEIIDGTQDTFTVSAATTPRSIAEQAGVVVYPEDYVETVPVTNFLAQQSISEQVIINRATPINVNLYGTQTVIRTHATTVGELLSEKHIVLKQGDSVQPAPATPLTAESQVFVIHKGTQIQTVSQTVPVPVQSIADSSLTVGTRAVRQQGSTGTELVTYQVNTQNGVVVSRTAIQTVVTQQPVAQIVAIGSAPLNNSLAEWLYKLRTCESGGNYQDDTGNGYYGAYQFSASTWNKWDTGYAYAYQAPPEVQDTVIIENTNASGGGLASQNPGCYAKEGLSAFPPGS
jgi:resuscitation-promoting factor RpfB